MRTPLAKLALVVFAATFTALGPAGTSDAHTDLDYTLPTDGAAVGEPVAEVTVAFHEPVGLVGPGFEVLDPQGNVLTPFVVTDDDRAFRLQIDPPIGGGEAAVRWHVRAEDGHDITGGITFVISVDAPSTTAAATTTVSAPTSTTASVVATTTTTTAAAITTTAATPTTTTITAAATASAAEVSSPAALASADSNAVPSEESNTSTIVALVALAVAAAAAVFLLLRSR